MGMAIMGPLADGGASEWATLKATIKIYTWGLDSPF